MILKRSSTIEQNLYTVEIAALDVTKRDLSLFQKWGEPLINLGGDFGDFTLPNYYRRLYSNSPHYYVSENQDHAETWQDEIETRIEQALLDLKSAEDSFTNEVFLGMPRTINIIPGRTNRIGRLYNTIIGGMFFFRNPSEVKDYSIFIRSNEVGKQYIKAEVGAFRDYVSVMGAGSRINMAILDVDVTKQCKIKNITVSLGSSLCAEADYINLNGVSFKNCNIYFYKDVVAQGCTFENCRIIGEWQFILDKNSDNIYTDVVNSIFNVSPVINNEEDYAGILDLKTFPQIPLKEDPTI